MTWYNIRMDEILYYTYIITNTNNTTLYIGVTSNLVKRIYEHKNKVVDGFTKKYRLENFSRFIAVSTEEHASK